MQVHLHGEALPTASKGTAEWLLSLVVSQDMTFQVEAASEVFPTPFSGAREHPLLSRVDAPLMQVQEPLVVKLLIALTTWQLHCRRKKKGPHSVQMQHVRVIRCSVMSSPSWCCTFMFFSVLQIFCPCLSQERTCFSLTRVSCSRETHQFQLRRLVKGRRECR